TQAATRITYGNGLAGTLGIPALTMVPLPVLGTNVTLTIGNSLGQGTIVAAYFGLDAADIPTPWGSDLLVQPDLLITFVLPAAGLSSVMVVPNDDVLVGQDFFLQVLEVDDGAVNGISFTQALQIFPGF